MLQQTLDNGAIDKLLDLERKGYLFGVARRKDGREVLLFKAKPDAEISPVASAQLQDLRRHGQELCAYLTNRGKHNAQVCRRIAEYAQVCG